VARAVSHSPESGATCRSSPAQLTLHQAGLRAGCVHRRPRDRPAARLRCVRAWATGCSRANCPTGTACRGVGAKRRGQAIIEQLVGHARASARPSDRPACRVVATPKNALAPAPTSARGVVAVFPFGSFGSSRRSVARIIQLRLAISLVATPSAHSASMKPDASRPRSRCACRPSKLPTPGARADAQPFGQQAVRACTMSS